MTADALETFPGWESIEKLGEGGMCAVYRVRPIDGVGPERAIKVLYDRAVASVDRFIAEARILQSIDHPNVIRVHELHDEVRPPWLVMDILAGKDLEENRKEQGAMDPERAARCYAAVASGLATVHALGVRHRDIKPANIMLGHDGVPRLIDFGIARDPNAARLTGKGLVMGTAAYLPPEVFWAEEPNSAQESTAADVYALGQSLCESLSGKPVYDLESLGGNALVAIMKDKLDRPHLDPRHWRSSVPADLAELVIAATERESENRTQTAAELESRLRAWLEARQGAGKGAAPVSRLTELPPPPAAPSMAPTRFEDPPPTSGRGRGTAAAASFAGLGLVVAGWTLILLLGVGVLWALKPDHGVDPGVRTSVNMMAKTQRGLFDKCKRPRVRGEVVVRYKVDNGKVASAVSVDRTTIANAELERCVTSTVQEMRFTPRDGSVTIVMPVEFR